jgi:hypothetical protein
LFAPFSALPASTGLVFRLIIRLKLFTYGTLMTKALPPLAFGLTLLVVGCAENAEKVTSGFAKEKISERSAAADWSRFPVGTKFRVVDNNKGSNS